MIDIKDERYTTMDAKLFSEEYQETLIYLKKDVFKDMIDHPDGTMPTLLKKMEKLFKGKELGYVTLALVAQLEYISYKYGYLLNDHQRNSIKEELEMKKHIKLSLAHQGQFGRITKIRRSNMKEALNNLDDKSWGGH